MRLLLRADASPAAGSGHVMRCIALAEGARALGHDVSLAGSVFGVHWLAGLLQDLNVVSPPPWQDLVAWASAHGFDALHLDDYTAPRDLRTGSTAAGILLSNIEDGGWGRRPADVVVDASLGAEGQVRPDDGSPMVLRGVGQTIVRAAVRRGRLRAAVRHADTGADLKVLVVMGGTDPHTVLPDVLQALARAAEEPGVPPLRVCAVMNDATVPPSLALKVTPMSPAAGLVDEMADADLVVTAAGTTMSELCCLGVPMAIVPVADNQLSGYREVIARGLAVGLGDPQSPGLRPEAWRALAAALASTRHRVQLARSGSALVDGAGAARVLRAIEDGVGGPPRPAPPLHPRPASAADSGSLLAWRNDPVARGASRRRNVIDASDHEAWLRAILDASDRHLMVVEDSAAQPVGSVRWDRTEQFRASWEISIGLAPHHRGRGWGGAVLAAGERALLSAEPAARQLLATVHNDNLASLSLFTGAGYRASTEPDADGFRVLARRVR